MLLDRLVKFFYSSSDLIIGQQRFSPILQPNHKELSFSVCRNPSSDRNHRDEDRFQKLLSCLNIPLQTAQYQTTLFECLLYALFDFACLRISTLWTLFIGNTNNRCVYGTSTVYGNRTQQKENHNSGNEWKCSTYAQTYLKIQYSNYHIFIIKFIEFWHWESFVHF